MMGITPIPDKVFRQGLWKIFQTVSVAVGKLLFVEIWIPYKCISTLKSHATLILRVLRDPDLKFIYIPAFT